MTDLEIPVPKDRKGHYRFFEILPGALSYSMLVLPLALSFINVTLAAVFILVYLLINFTRGIAGAIRGLHGFHVMRQHQKMPWSAMLTELEVGKITSSHTNRPKWHREAVARTHTQPLLLPPSDIVQAIIIATYQETREVLEPTIKSIIAGDYDMKKVLVILAYEERGGIRTKQQAIELIDEYKNVFMDAIAVEHPANIPGEIIGKGGNVTFAGRYLQTYLEAHNINPLRVMVTTLDADNRPDKNYLNALSYIYAAAPDPVHAAYQPVSLYTNNIWDAPAPMRVLATGNSLFNLVVSLRLHALRNFSSHAQPLAALIETDFWSVRTIVEDGHQFWRSYFRFDGRYRVLPLNLPIYQDAVLSDSYKKTLRAQFIQLRRWTYGASDVAYVVDKGFYHKNNVPRLDLIAKLWRLLEGHVTWAVGPLLVALSGFIPALFHPKSFAANELPLIVSRVQTIGLAALIITVFMALRTLPPKPARYKRHRTVFMVLQWVYFPVTTLLYNSLAAFNSQTRLMFKRYPIKFDVTEKAVVIDTKSKTIIKS